MHTQVYTASLDGTICSWNLSTGRLVHHWNVGFPIVSLAVTGDADNQVAHVSCQWNQGTAGRVLYVRLSDGTMLPRRLKLSKASPLVAAGSTVATWDRRTLFVWTHAAAGMDLPLRLIHTKNFTVGGISALTSCLARLLSYNYVGVGVVFFCCWYLARFILNKTPAIACVYALT